MNTVNYLQMGFEFGAGFSVAVLFCGMVGFSTWVLCDIFFNVIRSIRCKYKAAKERKKQYGRWRQDDPSKAVEDLRVGES